MRNPPNELLAQVALVLREANGGEWPSNIWQWKRVARRFGTRVRFVSREITDSPHLRRRVKVAYIPKTRRRDLLARYLIHEITEAALLWEGTEPYLCPTHSRHDVAVTMEENC